MSRTVAKYLSLAALLLAAGLGADALVRSSHEEGDLRLATAALRSFDITVDAIGLLDAANAHMVSSAVRGDRGKIIHLVPDGTPVQAGDLLVRLDPAPFEEEVERLEGEALALEAALAAAEQLLAWERSQVERETRTAAFNLTVAELELKRLAEGEGPLKLAGLKAEVGKAAEELRRYRAYIEDLQQLAARGFDHAREILSARQKCDELQNTLTAAEENQRYYENHVLPATVKAAEAKASQAAMELAQLKKGGVFKEAKAAAARDEIDGKLAAVRNALEAARRELHKTFIRAPSAGIAVHFEAYRDGTKRKPREGDRVLQYQPLLYLPDISTMLVKTQVREIDLHRLAVGQACRVRVDAYPETDFEGTVTFIGMLASENARLGRGEKYFDLTVTLRAADDRLRPGMTARVSILSEQVADQLAVPLQAVFERSGASICYRYRERAFAPVPVVTGPRNEVFAVILSGLTAGDRVSLVEPAVD